MKKNTDTKQVKRTGIQVMAKLIGLVRPLISVMILAVLLGVTGFLCAIFLNVFGAEAIANVIGFDTGMQLKRIFIMIVVFGALRGILHYGEQLCNHYIAFHLLALIRDKIFGALRRLSPAKLETKEKGNLISIITSDIELLEVFYAHTISPIVIAIVTSVLMLIFFGTLHPLMCVVAACGYLMVGLFMPWLVSNLGRNAGSAYRNEFGAFDSFFLGSLRGLRETIQFGGQKKRLEEIGERTRSLSKKQKKMKQCTGIGVALTGCIVSAFSLIMLFTGIHLYETGAVSYMDVLVGTVAMMSSFGPVIALSGLAGNLLHTFASGNRVLDILEEVPAVEEVTDGQDVIFSGVEAQDVHFSYGMRADGKLAVQQNGKKPDLRTGNTIGEEAESDVVAEILRGVSLSVKPGQIIGINGPSGCGKSTFLKLLMRFWDVNTGEVSVSDTAIQRINTHCLRSMEGFVTQETQLFNDTIENNLRIAKQDATHEEIVAAARAASLHEFIESLEHGYETNVGELGDRLSGGERQRIGIARAFLHEAPFLLLDEPTSNLDSLNEGIILKSLSEKRADKTVILVSHRKSTMGIADVVYQMADGKVKEA